MSGLQIMAINAAKINGITIALAALIPASTMTKAAKIIKLLFTPVKLANTIILLLLFGFSVRQKLIE